MYFINFSSRQITASQKIQSSKSLSFLFWKLLFCGITILLGAPLQGAINPEEFTRRAPEIVRIQIEGSAVRGNPQITQVTLLAQVLEVSETSSGLKAGDVLLILYEQDHAKYQKEARAMEKKARTGWVGPQVLYYPPALETGAVVLAHLKKSQEDSMTGATFRPVGYQYAFEFSP